MASNTDVVKKNYSITCSGVLGGGVYAGIRRIPTSGFFLTAYTHLSDHK